MKRAGGILLLCLLLAAAFSVAAGAGERAEISIISANISGLPAVFSKYDRDVPASQKTLGRMLKESSNTIPTRAAIITSITTATAVTSTARIITARGTEWRNTVNRI